MLYINENYELEEMFEDDIDFDLIKLAIESFIRNYLPVFHTKEIIEEYLKGIFSFKIFIEIVNKTWNVKIYKNHEVSEVKISL